jgi:hypothetical protein
MQGTEELGEEETTGVTYPRYSKEEFAVIDIETGAYAVDRGEIVAAVHAGRR